MVQEVENVFWMENLLRGTQLVYTEKHGSSMHGASPTPSQDGKVAMHTAKETDLSYVPSTSPGGRVTLIFVSATNTVRQDRRIPVKPPMGYSRSDITSDH